ncbi:hypothetical protein GUITHDRAFT_144469 [Guillardia theta CCMP2712]|uniref:Uncharacterized protein n=1 Tax=Guillardia theta (strain CCMP2712) TaxID=905079 RepID=L1IPI0_GUITC|nr:hypothetical protein GUITHDRAFT_144469 [Guillardia theta CCMP2712]EKX38173.1 hypothetical protein GUITHDRAFT_144469 [Guillardia theta CCMP2712]|eukprot:XP_005825153.1 hypothetical protein GUITHDRAFT_144469 [Guillardia theta CCMP2712]
MALMDDDKPNAHSAPVLGEHSPALQVPSSHAATNDDENQRHRALEVVFDRLHRLQKILYCGADAAPIEILDEIFRCIMTAGPCSLSSSHVAIRLLKTGEKSQLPALTKSDSRSAMAPAPADMLAHRRPRMSVGQKHVGVQVESCFDDTDHFTETIHSIEVDENEAPVTHSTPRHLLPVFATVSPSKSFWKFSQAADKRLMELEESVHMHEKQRELYLRRIEDLEDELQAYKMRFDKAQNWLTATTSNGLYQNVAEAKILPVPPQRIIHEDSSFTAFSNSKKLLMGLLDPPVSDGSWPVTSDGDVLPGAWAADPGT